MRTFQARVSEMYGDGERFCLGVEGRAVAVFSSLAEAKAACSQCGSTLANSAREAAVMMGLRLREKQVASGKVTA